MKNAPVAVFVYNRADKAQSCLEALAANRECRQTELYIFADGARTFEDEIKVREVRNYINDYISKSNFAKVHFRESTYNKGLANSIISGVSEVISQHGRIIVIEDDLVVSRDFLNYMNGALNFYENNPMIGSVTGYTLPMKALKHYKRDIYLLRKGESLGWGTWKDRWDEVDWEVSDFDEYKKEGKIRKEFASVGYGFDDMLCGYMDGNLDVWAVRWCYHLYKRKMLTVYPRISRVNIILDETATHCDCATDRYSHSSIGSDTKPVYEVLEMNKKLERASWNYDAGGAFSINRIKIYFSQLWRKL